MHVWGDDWPHWDELYQAEHWIANYVYKYSRCRLMSKEKWGSIRYEYIFPPGGRLMRVSSIKMPFMTVDYGWDRQANKSDNKYYLGYKGKYPVILWRWCDSWLYNKWCRLGRYVLSKAIKKACIKFPNVVEEITCDYYADCI